MQSFDEPKESAPLIAMAKLMLPALLLLRHGTTQIKVAAGALERFQKVGGARAIICPNHSSWDDTDMIFAFSNLVKENFNYLTAWEVLHSHFGFRKWLQHVGCYSIIRGYPDRASYKATRDLLVRGRHKIVIFPEGEISHDSANLLPLKRGVAQMAFSALQKMEREGASAPVYVIPMALRYKLQGDARPALEEALAGLEKALNMPLDHNTPLYLRIKKVSRILLARLEQVYSEHADPDLPFDHRVDALRTQILEHVSAQLHVVLPSGLSHLESAHVLQSSLYALTYGLLPKELWSPGLSLRETKKKLRALAKDLHRVVDFISIYDGFVTAESSVERLAEVVDLLEAEVLHRRSHKGVKVVTFNVGEPIDLLDFYGQYKTNKIAAEDAVMKIYKDCMFSMLR